MRHRQLLLNFHAEIPELTSDKLFCGDLLSLLVEEYLIWLHRWQRSNVVWSYRPVLRFNKICFTGLPEICSEETYRVPWILSHWFDVGKPCNTNSVQVQSVISKARFVMNKIVYIIIIIVIIIQELQPGSNLDRPSNALPVHSVRCHSSLYIRLVFWSPVS